MAFDFLEPEVSDLFELFLSGLGKNTRIHYIIAVRDICLAKGSFLSLSSYDISDYFMSLKKADSTKSAAFYSMRSFSVFLTYHIDGYVSPFIYLGLGRCAPDYSMDDFPEETLPELFHFLGDDSDAALAVRFALHMCLSVSEIVSLDSGMFSFNDNSSCTLFLPRVDPSGQSDGIAKLQVPDILSAPVRERMNRDFLLLNKRGRPASVRFLQRQLKDSDTGWTFYLLRCYGMFLKLLQGCSRAEVSEYAGVDGRWLYRFNKLLRHV